MCLVFLQTASIWPPSLGRQHKALRRCRLLLHRKWSEWARTSNNSLNECTAQEPYIKTVNVSTLWSCGEPARLHLSAALCGCCPPPLLFLLPLLFSRCNWAGCVQPSSDCERDAERHCLDYITMATLLPEHRWLQRGFTQRRMCVRRGGSHVRASSPNLTHSFCVTCLFSLFPFIHIQHLHISSLSPPLPHPPLLTHTFIICTVMSSSSSFLLIHPFLSLTLCTHTRPHLIAFSPSPLGHTGEARVAASISHWRHKLSPWQQPKVAAACWSFRNPSLCFLYGSVNTCKSFKPYNPCLSLSASLMFLCKDCYLVHRDHSQFKLGTSYRRNIRQVDDRKHKVASPNRYFFMLKAR